MCHAVVLIVRLRDAEHIARISSAEQVCSSAVAAESGFSVAPAVHVELPTVNLCLSRLVRDADCIQVEVWLRPMREVIDVLECILRARAVPPRHSIWLCPDVRLKPSPAHLLQGQN